MKTTTLTLKKADGTEYKKVSLLETPFGLVNWATDNYVFFFHESTPTLHHITHKWHSISMTKNKRRTFLDVVQKYYNHINNLESAYIFFDAQDLFNYIAPVYSLLPKASAAQDIEGTVTLSKPRKIGIPIANLTPIDFEDATDFRLTLTNYKKEFKKLLTFAEELYHNENLIFNCSK